MAKAAWNIISGLFLSTPSARRAITGSAQTSHDPAISIHALREEGDHRQRPDQP